MEPVATLDAVLPLRKQDQELTPEDRARGVNLRTAYVNKFMVST